MWGKDPWIDGAKPPWYKRPRPLAAVVMVVVIVLLVLVSSRGSRATATPPAREAGDSSMVLIDERWIGVSVPSGSTLGSKLCHRSDVAHHPSTARSFSRPAGAGELVGGTF
jgi:hypothetical protein